MLGYVIGRDRGQADALLFDVAHDLRAGGVAVAGAVQVNHERDPSHKCDMDLHILSGADVVRISQNLGVLSRGCRLDPAGLERAVGLVGAALDHGAALVIVNKFGKQELDGRGFCPVIAEALGRDIPVLTAVNAGNLRGFQDWAGDLAQEVAPDHDAVLAWAASHGIAPTARPA